MNDNEYTLHMTKTIVRSSLIALVATIVGGASCNVAQSRYEVQVSANARAAKEAELATQWSREQQARRAAQEK